ncbi:PREDICTED: uncharacterized protein LOC104596024 [Nelumbo nucifera]|uniref:Uncharacterized protein LOC104596024 n=1 Tax=Nelumbo nucifera TaxID=4432 RepID=A0A1U7ZPK7_NELNU|nr:PREDICTED: uncharacterized protein LOC104596024 [Nelumbo nucifera]
MIVEIMRTRSSFFFSNSFLVYAFLILVLIVAENGVIVRLADGGKRVHIPDELDDVIDDEEDEAWKEWGKKSSPSQEFDPPPMDLSGMELSQIQEEMMKHHFGPSFGFVKLRLGVRRSAEMVAETAMKWTKVLKTGSIEAKFMAVDGNTLMFTMERGKDTTELKDFVLSQPDAYEIKIGDRVFRRPGDPPLEEVIEMLHRDKNKAEDAGVVQEREHLKDEL